MWEVNGMDVFTEGSIVIDYGLFCLFFVQKSGLNWNALIMMDLFIL